MDKKLFLGNYKEDCFSVDYNIIDFIEEEIEEGGNIAILSDIVDKYKREIEAHNYIIDNRIDTNSYLKNQVVMVGNYLSFLNSKKEVEEKIEESYNVLDKNGYIIIQIINNDKIIKKSIDNLPTIFVDFDNREIEFKRKYIVNGEEIELIIDTLENGKKIKETSNEKMTLLLKQDLIDILEKVGFSNIEVYGSFKKEKFDIVDSNIIVVRAQKYSTILEDKPEYEQYSSNYVKEKCKCGGCKNKCNKDCSSCNKGCCRNK